MALLRHATDLFLGVFCLFFLFYYDSSFLQIPLQNIKKVRANTQDMRCHGTNTNPDACGFMIKIEVIQMH